MHQTTNTQAPHPDISVQAFIAKWLGKDGSERANYQLFITELCEVLGVPKPNPAHKESADNAYTFERHVKIGFGDGTETDGYLDCYRRGAFVLEAKKVRAGTHTKGYGDALLRARTQAEAYARALPATEGRPPFLIVVDVGNVIELYAEFTRSGATYTPFPDSRSHRIKLADLQDAKVRERLRQVWLEPLALDPSRISAEVTRDVAAHLAELARSLESNGHGSEKVAAFLTRALFCMFAEDVELLPKDSFRGLLERYLDEPDTLAQMLHVLWKDMDSGGFSPALTRHVLRFNGKIFKGHGHDGYVLPLSKSQINTLLQAAKADWKSVEPAIFGTLLERALNPDERHALGAHYTPRAYVERLVLPTVMEPLRAQWADTQAAALLLASEAHDLLHPVDTKGQPKAPTRKQELEAEKKLKAARDEVKRFHHHLCTLRVLDPACGSGNFLYVTLEHLKRLEGEVLNQLSDLGDTQDKLGLEGETVTPKQLLGIELNRRAAALAELVLWIGHLQWHIRTQGNASVAEPVVHDFGNIENRDAVLAFDTQEPALDAQGKLLTRWDGKTFKPHPVTGKPVPDEAAQVPQWRYLNPRAAQWPQADYIVGNPPFIGSKRMRTLLGDGYVDALQAAWPDVPEASDFVMRWWHRAAIKVKDGSTHRFGFITSNSLRQTYVRRAVEPHLLGDDRLSIVFAVPDHPWVDSTDGAAVRICMTVAELGLKAGVLREVTSERQEDGEGDLVETTQDRFGLIAPDLRVGVDLTKAAPLQSNMDVCSVGMKTIGSAFQIDKEQAIKLGLESVPGLREHIRPYFSGKDFVAQSRSLWIIDLFGLDELQLRARFPAVYQYLHDRAKPERDQNRNAVFKRLWWVIGHPRPQLRCSLVGLDRYIVTVETAKHRVFGFLAIETVPDSTLVAVSSADALHLGILSSVTHEVWALATGGRLGVGNDPRYNKTRCFETFPFPADDTGFDTSSPLATTIRAHAEAIDAHRKRVLASPEGAKAGLTLTGIYNVLEALRAARPLSAKEKLHHDVGLVGVLQSLHDELDAAVLQAYGWQDLGPTPWGDSEEQVTARQTWTEELLTRLVALNARRAADEACGQVRWLRPEFQDPSRRAATATADAAAFAKPPVASPAPGTQADDQDEDSETPDQARPLHVAASVTRRAWPAELPEQMRATAEVLSSSAIALSETQVADHFKGQGPWKKRLPQILDTLEAVGRARKIRINEVTLWGRM
jgi:hypothetical protein